MIDLSNTEVNEEEVQEIVDFLTELGIDDGTNETIPLPPDILYGNITENAQPLLAEEVQASNSRRTQ